MAVPPERVTVLDADSVVNAPAPLYADRSSVPPKVKLPDVVTVPDNEMPLTVPVPPTLVTVPPPSATHSRAVAPELSLRPLLPLPV